MSDNSHNCEACRGNVAPNRICYACGLKGPAGEGKLMCPECLRFGPHECRAKSERKDPTNA
jgi:hypothetical protein